MAKDYKIKTLKNGEKRYIFDVNLGYKSDGTRIRTTVTSKSVSDGRKKVAELLLGNKHITENDAPTFETAYKTYLKDCKPKMSAVTIFNKEYLFKTSFVFLHQTKLKKIDELDIKQLHTNLSSLAPSTVRKNDNQLCAFFNWCVKNKLMDVNPYTYIDKVKEQKKEMQFYTEKEFIKFISSIDNLYYKTIFEFLFYTGVRKGELFALKDEDIKNNRIHLKRTVKKAKKLIIDENMKTEQSNRIIPIPKWLKIPYSERFEYKGELYIFNPKDYNSIGRTSKKYMCEADLHIIRIHDFRHSFASFIINNNRIELYDLMKIMGHKDIKMTTNRYGHMYKDKYEQITNGYGEVKPYGS